MFHCLDHPPYQIQGWWSNVWKLVRNGEKNDVNQCE